MSLEEIQITVTVRRCSECPKLSYSPEGSNCTVLPFMDSFVYPEGRRKINKKCPYLTGSSQLFPNGIGGIE